MNIVRKALERGLNPANVISWLCQQWLVRWGRFWGTLALRVKADLLGVRVGRGVRAHGPVGLMRWPGGKICIGDRVQMISSWRRATASTIAAPVRLRVFGPGAVIEIGEGTELSGTSITARSTHISIGKQVLIAPDCAIVDSDFHAPWPCEARAVEPGMERDAPVVIEDYAWIGMRSVILKGVRIGRGAIVGAGSVVTRDVPAGCTACGVPAKIVKQAPAEGAVTTLLRPEHL